MDTQSIKILDLNHQSQHFSVKQNQPGFDRAGAKRNAIYSILLDNGRNERLCFCLPLQLSRENVQGWKRFLFLPLGYQYVVGFHLWPSTWLSGDLSPDKHNNQPVSYLQKHDKN